MTLCRRITASLRSRTLVDIRAHPAVRSRAHSSEAGATTSPIAQRDPKPQGELERRPHRTQEGQLNLLHLYRHFLRAIAASVRFSRPATKNLRRLYRSEFERLLLERRERENGGSGLVADIARRDGKGKGEKVDVGENDLFDYGESVRPLFCDFWPRRVAVASPAARSEQICLQDMRRLQWTESLSYHPLVPAQTESDHFLLYPPSAPKARNTLALFLSSSHSPRSSFLSSSTNADPNSSTRTATAIPARPSKPSRPLSHHLTSNLSSLTYHHLSPYTRMQSLTVVSGGTPRDTSLSPSALRLHAQARAEARAEGQGDLPTSLETEQIQVLNVPPKPVRGPKQAREFRWDGQKPPSFSPSSSSSAFASPTVRFAALEEDVRLRSSEYDALLHARGPTHTHTQRARASLISARGALKGARKAAEKVRTQAMLESAPVEMVREALRRAQEGEKVWLGGRRWEMKSEEGAFADEARRRAPA